MTVFGRLPTFNRGMRLPDISAKEMNNLGDAVAARVGMQPQVIQPRAKATFQAMPKPCLERATWA